MTYTAFFVPYSVTFGLEDCSWNSSSAMVDFVFGWLYVVDMMINFRVGYSLEYKGSRVLELSGPRAAATGARAVSGLHAARAGAAILP